MRFERGAQLIYDIRYGATVGRVSSVSEKSNFPYCMAAFKYGDLRPNKFMNFIILSEKQKKTL